MYFENLNLILDIAYIKEIGLENYEDNFKYSLFLANSFNSLNSYVYLKNYFIFQINYRLNLLKIIGYNDVNYDQITLDTILFDSEINIKLDNCVF
jgi:hypothetical protein